MSLFRVQEHKLLSAHIRDNPRALAGEQEDTLQIAIKQYTPLDNASPQKGDVTLIGAHANGFPKELYEPLWDDLYKRLKTKNINIRNIWIADVAHQGESGVLNENKLGDDPSWNDHPRDLFVMVNHFRDQIKRPIIGVGHSMGGCHLVNLSLMHPRLFTTLILIDPVIHKVPSKQGNLGPARASTTRRDRWPSRTAAEAAFKRSKFYQAWEPKVLDLWVRYGLRDLPTYVYPQVTAASGTLPTITADPSTATVHPDRDTEVEVTLATTKHQEVLTFMRPNFPSASHPNPETDPDLIAHPEIDTSTGPNSPFYRAEPIVTFRKLPNLRPSVLYLFGDQSFLSSPPFKAEKMAVTGVGVGGSGGVKRGRVKEITFEGVGHLIPMEAVGKTADACADWTASEVEIWEAREAIHVAQWSRVPSSEKGKLSADYVKIMTGQVIGNEPGPKASKPKL